MDDFKAIDLIGQAVKIKLLNGKEYSLLYDLKAMAILEDAMDEDTPLAKKLKAMFEQRQPSWRAVRYLLWLGMLHFHPEVKEEDVGELVDVRMLTEVVEKISEALGLAMGESTEEKKIARDGLTGQSSTSLRGE